MTVVLAFGKLTQEDFCEFEANLGYIASLYVSKKTPKPNPNNKKHPLKPLITKHRYFICNKKYQVQFEITIVC